MNKDGTIETVADMIECLKKCDLKAKIRVRYKDTQVTIVQEPGNNIAYVDIK